MFAAYVEGQSAGFVSLKRHTEFASEVYLLGVKRQFHRQGIGRCIIGAAVNFAARQGASFLTVKTLGPSNPDPNYAATRRFYRAVGFVPIEVFPTLWNANNPCLLMMRQLTR
jgi:ribosomal protein S18 acetylase RimI-like enzyme